MARAVSRKSSPKRISRRLSTHRKCVSETSKKMHKKANRSRSHQLALSRAATACAKKAAKRSPAKRSRKVQSRKGGKRMSGLMDKMKGAYAKAKQSAKNTYAKYQQRNTSESTETSE